MMTSQSCRLIDILRLVCLILQDIERKVNINIVVLVGMRQKIVLVTFSCFSLIRFNRLCLYGMYIVFKY